MDKTLLVGIIGTSTVIIATLVKIIGLPDQIRKNFKRKSTEGLSVPFFLLGLLSYILWTVYGLLQNDIVVALGQGFGVITMGIIAYQIWIYRRKSE
jgi:uncharacterized protein with PQ loop repeat